MRAPVEPNSTSVILWERRTYSLCVNTAETILPSELTEKTHLYWGETDDQRRTCRTREGDKRGRDEMGRRQAEGGSVKEREDRPFAKCPFQRWMEREWGDRRQGRYRPGAEWGYKRKYGTELYGETEAWEDWEDFGILSAQPDGTPVSLH